MMGKAGIQEMSWKKENKGNFPLRNSMLNVSYILDIPGSARGRN